MAGTRIVFRGSRGRFAGASNGKSERVRTGGSSFSSTSTRAAPLRATRATPSRTVSQPQRSVGTRAKAIASNRKVQIGAGVIVAGVGGRVAYNKINPGTSLLKSGVTVPGVVATFGGKNSSRPDYTVVTNKTHRFTTFSQTSGPRGIKKNSYTTVEKFGKSGRATPVGYVDSRRSLLGGYKVTHTYLTAGERGRGLGKQALAAHAAHRPTRTFRADINRSNMGQGLARSVGAAGRRSRKSKAQGKDITKVLDYDWRTASRAVRASTAKNVLASTKGLTPHATKLSGKRIRR